MMATSNAICKPLFLLRPVVVPGEQIEEYLQRLAKANRLEGPEEILKLIGVPLSHIVASGYQKLQSVIQGEAPPNSLRFISDRGNASGVFSVKSASLTFARVCVSCLKETDVLSADWSHPLSVSCAKHQHLLLDKCPSCNRAISRKRSQYKCDCGLSFAELTASPRPFWEYRFHEIFAPWRLISAQSHSPTEILRLETYSAEALRQAIRGSGEQSLMANRIVKNWLFSSDFKFIERICAPDFSLSTLEGYAPLFLKRLTGRIICFKIKHADFVAGNDPSKLSA